MIENTLGADTALARVRRHTIGDIPRRSAHRQPDKVAIIDGPVTLTFAEFDDLVNRAAAALHDNDFRPGDRIALLSHNCWQYAVLAFAAARAAVVLVPINFMLNPGEIAYILKHCRATGFIVEDELVATAEQAMQLGGTVNTKVVLTNADFRVVDSGQFPAAGAGS
jgi:fatty-acyl-CoA synthase